MKVIAARSTAKRAHDASNRGTFISAEATQSAAYVAVSSLTRRFIRIILLFRLGW